MNPPLFIGGSGVVGSAAVRWFRQRHPNIPVLIGGRNLSRAEEIARNVAPAQAVRVDLDEAGLGLPRSLAVSAIAMLAPDHGLHGLTYAQEHGLPYVSISTGLSEVASELAHCVHRPTAAPVVLASHWSAGAPLFLALRDADAFEQVRSVRVGVILDEDDPAGPAAHEDLERLAEANPGALAFEAGRRVWLLGDSAKTTVEALDGRRLDAQAFSSLDVPSLHAATGAPNVRFDLALDVSSSRRRGGDAAAEVSVEVEGELGGRPVQARSVLEFKPGQASLTGLSAVLTLSAALGLAERPPAPPGLYLPESLSGPGWFLDQLTAAGAEIHRRQSSEV